MGQLVFVIIILEVFFDKMEGLSRAMFFLVGRNMALVELSMDMFKWSSGSRCQAPAHGQAGDALYIPDGRFI